LVGKKNRYTCQSCGHAYVTVDKDDGTTPFMAPCQAKGCKGMAQSEFYRVPQNLEASHEWYRMGPAEARGLAAHLRQHHEMGGLFLRRVTVPMALRSDIEIAVCGAKPMPDGDASGCAHTNQDSGFGLAGGGYGVYMYCKDCGHILSKTQTD
jgi:hypothetical protein